MWSILTGVPLQVASEMVFPYFDLKDIVQLDSAIIQPRERSRVHEMLKSSSPVFVDASLTRNTAALSWLFDRRIRIKDVKIGSNDISMLSLLNSNINLLGRGIHMDCSIFDAPKGAVLDLVRPMLAKVDGLHLSSKCDASALLIISETMRNLRSLAIVRYSVQTNISLRTVAITQKILVNNARSLEALQLHCLQSLTSPLPEGFRLETLRELDISMRSNNAPLLTLARVCNSLRKLKLLIDCVDASLLESSITALAQSNPGLEEVNFEFAEQAPTERSIWAFAHHCPRLHKMILLEPCECACYVSLETVQAFAAHCPLLRSFYMCWDYDVSEEALLTVRSLFARLEELYLPKFISEAVVSRSGLVRVLRCASKLRLLGNAPHSHPCVLHAEEIYALADTCCELRVIQVTFAAGQSLREADALYDLIAHNPHLTELHSGFEGRVDDALLEAIGKHCRGFEKLILCNKTPGFTDRGVMALAAGCPQLKELTEYACDAPGHVTDASLCALAQHCSRLHTLLLSYYDQVTEVGLWEIVRNCRHLRILGLHSAHISLGAEKAVREQHPRLQLRIRRAQGFVRRARSQAVQQLLSSAYVLPEAEVVGVIPANQSRSSTCAVM